MGCGGDLNLLQAGVGLFSIKASKPVVYAARTLEKVLGVSGKFCCGTLLNLEQAL